MRGNATNILYQKTRIANKTSDRERMLLSSLKVNGIEVIQEKERILFEVKDETGVAGDTNQINYFQIKNEDYSLFKNVLISIYQGVNLKKKNEWSVEEQKKNLASFKGGEATPAYEAEIIEEGRVLKFLHSPANEELNEHYAMVITEGFTCEKSILDSPVFLFTKKQMTAMYNYFQETNERS